MLRVLLGVLAMGSALLAWPLACAVTPLEEVLQGKACTPQGECAPGYECDHASRTCVPEGTAHGGGSTGGSGGSTGGGAQGGSAGGGGSPPGCNDGAVGGGETDVDCGGLDCSPCDNGLKCLQAGDCISGLCAGSTGGGGQGGGSGLGECAPCLTTADCAASDPPAWCDGGVCLPQKALGDNCGVHEQCDSGHCADGVCCDGPCAGSCMACDLPASEGTCTEVADSTPCSDGWFCNGTESCSGGVCGGSSGNPCPGHDTGPQCKDSCNESGDACDASDLSGTTCPGGFCDGAGTCMKNDGEPCGAPAECSSGYCVDSVCCQSACAGSCRTCDGSSPGSCEIYAVGTDPEGECSSPQDAGPSCNAGACACGVDPQGANTATFNNPNGNVTCPVGQHCSVSCTASGSCQGIDVICPPGHSCTLSCQAPSACNNADLMCGSDGVCALICSGSSCVGTAVACGQDACSASCGGASNVALVPGSSCMVTDDCL